VHRGRWPCRILPTSKIHGEIRLGTIVAWWWSDKAGGRWLATVEVEPHGIEELLAGDRLERADDAEEFLISHPAVSPGEVSPEPERGMTAS